MPTFDFRGARVCAAPNMARVPRVLTQIRRNPGRGHTIAYARAPIPIHMVESKEKKTELKAFLFLTVVMAPALAGIVIGGYGLMVWIYQMFAGPPTG